MYDIGLHKMGFNKHFLGPGYVKYIYDNIQDLYKRILKTQQNVQKILKNIQSWGTVPLYQRKNGNVQQVLDTDNLKEQFLARTVKIADTKDLICYVIEENYRLFFDLSLSIINDDIEVANKRNAEIAAEKKKRFELFLGLHKSMDNLLDVKTDVNCCCYFNLKVLKNYLRIFM